MNGCFAAVILNPVQSVAMDGVSTVKRPAVSSTVQSLSTAVQREQLAMALFENAQVGLS